jgi:hypothetical protein
MTEKETAKEQWTKEKNALWLKIEIVARLYINGAISKKDFETFMDEQAELEKAKKKKEAPNANN